MTTLSAMKRLDTLLSKLQQVLTTSTITASSTEISNQKTYLYRANQSLKLETLDLLKKLDIPLHLQSMCQLDGTEPLKMFLAAEVITTLQTYLLLVALWQSFIHSSHCFLVVLRWTNLKKFQGFSASQVMTIGQMLKDFLTESCSKCLIMRKYLLRRQSIERHLKQLT